MNDRLLNFTPHAITLYVADGTTQTVPSCGIIRLTSELQCELPPYGGVRVTTPQVFNGIEGLPILNPSVIDGIIVSAVVGEYMAKNEISLHGIHVFSPGDLVRDARGQPIGARTLELHVPVHSAECNAPACLQCSARDCPANDVLHYHHDGCPSCSAV